MSQIEKALELIGLKINQEFKWQDLKISTYTYLCKVAQDGTVYVWCPKEGKWDTRMFINLRDLLYEPEKIIEVVKGPVIGETYYWFVSAPNNSKLWRIEPVQYNGSPQHIAMYEQGFMYSDLITAEHYFGKCFNKYGVIRSDRIVPENCTGNIITSSINNK